MSIHIQIILGSTRQDRFSEALLPWIQERFSEVTKKMDVTSEVIDLRDWPLDFYSEDMPPMALKGEYTSELPKKWEKKVSEGDGYIVLTPEYNHGYSAVLKNALDWVYYPWNNKPIGFVGWGSVEGARAIEQLRLVSIELQMVPIRNALHIKDFFALRDETGKLKEDALEDIEKPTQKFIEQLLWWARVLRDARRKDSPQF